MAEYLTAIVVLSILMINSFTGAHNISVWNSVELPLVIIRIRAILNRVWGSGVMKCKAKTPGLSQLRFMFRFTAFC